MYIKILMEIFLIMFLAGCATTGKGQNIQVQQLQNRINYLEAELQRKEQKINNLEDALETTKDGSLDSYRQTDGDTVRLSVRQIQTALKNAGFYKGLVDGKMGPKTKDAIKAFQKANDLKADGVVGKRTSSELNEYIKE